MKGFVVGRIGESFRENPGAWFLFALLLVTGYGNYQNGHHLRRVCENIQDMMREAPFPNRAIMAPWQRKEADEIAQICSEHLWEDD